MNQMINVTQGELEAVIILERIKNKDLTQAEGAELLKLCERQVRRKCRAYRNEGAQGVIHKGKGKKSNRCIEKGLAERILTIVRQNYLEQVGTLVGPTFYAEKLKEEHKITIDHETLRRLMVAAGLWQVRKTKQKKVHVWREPKYHRGELSQVDGSEHIWFGDDYATLVAFIDDATSSIMIAKFVAHESTESLGTLTLEYVEKYGRPLAVYSDRGSTYKINNDKSGKPGKTQFQRMLKELDIELIHARSPQAKGRVERLFNTMQERLVAELKLKGIVTIEEANRFLRETYIPWHNAKYAKKPLKNADYHRSIEGFDLHSIFCLKFSRTINNDHTISFKNRLFQLDVKQLVQIRAGEQIEVHQSFDKTIKLVRNKTNLSFHETNKAALESLRNRATEAAIDLLEEVKNRLGPTATEADIFNELRRGHF